ncbi:MAG: hypothetical protein A3F13_09945 [Gammaproteobacteria bacterium RIFCSPHIGHO2_12_FULL_40_19]|nr:MAG: hypothetical protein A3F13_09945 [Gammaproteobacteria bacterium RIFCSPHIGHO2_12_FULL_40_19]
MVRIMPYTLQPGDLVLTQEEIVECQRIVMDDSKLRSAYRYITQDGQKADKEMQKLIQQGYDSRTAQDRLRDHKRPENSLVQDPLNARQWNNTTQEWEDDATRRLRIMVMQASWAQNPQVGVTERDSSVPTYGWKQNPSGQLGFHRLSDGNYVFTGDAAGRKLVERLKQGLKEAPPMGTEKKDAAKLEQVIQKPEPYDFPLVCDLITTLKAKQNPSQAQAKTALGLRYLLWAKLNHETYLNLTKYLGRTGQLGMVRWVNERKDSFSRQHDRNWGIRCPDALPAFGYQQLVQNSGSQNKGNVMNHLGMDYVFAAENDADFEKMAVQETQVLWGELPAVENALQNLQILSKGDNARYLALLDEFITKVDMDNTCVTGRFKTACVWVDQQVAAAAVHGNQSDTPDFDKLYKLVTDCERVDAEEKHIGLDQEKVKEVGQLLTNWIQRYNGHSLAVGGGTHVEIKQENIEKILQSVMGSIDNQEAVKAAIITACQQAAVPAVQQQVAAVPPFPDVPPPPHQQQPQAVAAVPPPPPGPPPPLGHPPLPLVCPGIGFLAVGAGYRAAPTRSDSADYNLLYASSTDERLKKMASMLTTLSAALQPGESITIQPPNMARVIVGKGSKGGIYIEGATDYSGEKRHIYFNTDGTMATDPTKAPNPDREKLAAHLNRSLTWAAYNAFQKIENSTEYGNLRPPRAAGPGY